MGQVQLPSSHVLAHSLSWIHPSGPVGVGWVRVSEPRRNLFGTVCTSVLHVTVQTFMKSDSVHRIFTKLPVWSVVPGGVRAAKNDTHIFSRSMCASKRIRRGCVCVCESTQCDLHQERRSEALGGSFFFWNHLRMSYIRHGPYAPRIRILLLTPRHGLGGAVHSGSVAVPHLQPDL